MTRFCVVYIALIAVVHLQNGGIWGSANNLNPTCNTTECQRLGKYYLQNIDLLGQPCSDFYDYVCSNWRMHNPRPKELDIQYLWNVDHSLELRSYQEMRKLLESKVPSTSKEFEHAKLLYKTCMSIPYMERTNPSEAWKAMSKVSVFPLLLPVEKVLGEKPFFWEIDQAYIEKTGESALFDFHPLYDDSTNEILTNLDGIWSPYGSLARRVDWAGPNQLEHYKTFLTSIVQSSAEPYIKISKDAMGRQINEVVVFREKLNTIINKYVSSDKIEIVTIKKFQTWYNSNAKSTLHAADINWLSMIGAMYQNSSDHHKISITESSKVRVQTTYFLKLIDLLGTTAKRTLVNHIHLFFLEKHVEWTSQMKTTLMGSIAGTGLLGTVTSEIPRWKGCIDTNNLRTALGKAYVGSVFPPAQKAKAVALFEAAKKLMTIQIKQSTWLDNQTQVRSINKLEEVKSTLGYPDRYDATTPSKITLSEMDPIAPLALYMRDLNRVLFSAAGLQWPIYSPNVPYVIDYGSLVALMGNELYHVLDSEGIKRDAKGNSPFWSQTMIRKYHMNAMCFKNQYNKYKEQEVRKLTEDAFFTTQQDISDVMGLKLAYMGYKEMVKKNKGICPVLPGFETFGCDKLFFIAFANTQCSASLPGYNEMIWFKHGENMPKIKINGAVSNLKEFSTTFGCRKADTLNVESTCDLWRP